MAPVFAFGKDLWDPSHRFETSWLLPPYVLSFFRALFALYSFVIIVFILAWDCAHSDLGGCTQAQNEFSYFTVLTYWGLGFYFLAAAVHTFTYARAGSSLLDRLPRPLQALHALFYTTVIVYPFIVTAVYWGRLYQGPWFPIVFDAWSNVSRHALNSLMALFELLIPRTPVSLWIHMLWLVVILALYLALAYITRSTKGFYVYSFLDPATSGRASVAAYVFGIAIGCILVYLLVKGIVALRLWVTEKKLGMDGKFAHHGNWQGGDTEMAQAAPKEDRPES